MSEPRPARKRPGDERAKELFDLVEREIERRWEIPVRISDGVVV